MDNGKTKIITFDRILLIGILAVQILLFVRYFAPHKPAVHTAIPQKYGPGDGIITPPPLRPNLQVHTPAPSRSPGAGMHMRLPAPADEQDGNNMSYDPFTADPFAGMPDDFNDIFGGSPFRGIRDMNRRMDRMMERAAREFEEIESLMHFDKGWNTLSSSPSMDMRDAGDNYVLAFSLPGMDPSNVQITINNRILTVKAEYNGNTGNAHSYRMFERQIQLPGPVEPDKIEKSTMGNGILKITIPKRKNTAGAGKEIEL